jgi:hypothetical protein
VSGGGGGSGGGGAARLRVAVLLHPPSDFLLPALHEAHQAAAWRRRALAGEAYEAAFAAGGDAGDAAWAVGDVGEGAFAQLLRSSSAAPPVAMAVPSSGGGDSGSVRSRREYSFSAITRAWSLQEQGWAVAHIPYHAWDDAAVAAVVGSESASTPPGAQARTEAGMAAVRRRITAVVAAQVDRQLQARD